VRFARYGGPEVLEVVDAEEVVVETTTIVHKPPEVPWEQAGGLKVAGTTACVVP
jgi:NADPH:quinone reductase-like Zn-dependent oxidoreductase